MGRGEGNARSHSAVATRADRGIDRLAGFESYVEPFHDIELCAYDPSRYSEVSIGEVPRSDWPDFQGMTFLFDRALDTDEQERAKHIICYWAKPGNVFNGSDQNEWISPFQFWFDADSLESRSIDWRRNKDVFEILSDYMIEGTPMRKVGGTRAVEGIGFAPVKAVFSAPRHAKFIRPATYGSENKDVFVSGVSVNRSTGGADSLVSVLRTRN